MLLTINHYIKNYFKDFIEINFFYFRYFETIALTLKMFFKLFSLNKFIYH